MRRDAGVADRRGVRGTCCGRGARRGPDGAGSPVPSYTLGLRYWFSNGRHDYAFNASGADPLFGNPTSELSYKNIPG